MQLHVSRRPRLSSGNSEYKETKKNPKNGYPIRQCIIIEIAGKLSASGLRSWEKVYEPNT